MKYIVDNDLHIHSQLSLCSNDPMQNTKAILEYGVKNGFKHLCLTDHFWDSAVPGAMEWYEPQNLEHLKLALPLPQDENCAFHFGCEAEMDKNLTIGLAKEHYDEFDFIDLSITHMHMSGFTLPLEDCPYIDRRAKHYVERFDAVLKSDLPFNKLGLAHLTDGYVGGKGCGKQIIDLFNLISDDEFERLFTGAKNKGIGIELNFGLSKDEDMNAYHFRVFKIAKAMGCKFYFGSDSHYPSMFVGCKEKFEKIAETLKLTEDDKYNPFIK